ncbi:MAG: hypothetical protein IPK17_22645 [Chloroflexi bacterium]|uniref:hypothetical protein n=1 Tax=Candidatus Flexifilum breve TaxID=3140694 RepID=UPI0031374DAD|nr:hypothetical protein [Chloroflexota bacterium]
MSDLLSNGNRAIFAEYLVGTALQAIERPRIEWDGYDLLYRGKRIEVKASGYLQSWQQARPSTIRFDIAPKFAWDALTNTYAASGVRAADCYVFCLYAELDQGGVDVLDVEAWRFYPVLTTTLDTQYGAQKSIGLAGLNRLCQPLPFGELKKQIDALLCIEGYQ